MRCIFSNMRPLLTLHPPTSPSIAIPSLFAPHNLFLSRISTRPSVKLGMARVTSSPIPAVRSLYGGEVDGQDRLTDMRGCSGEIHVIVGPMFAGKTTELLKRAKSELANGRNVALVKSSKDNRYSSDSVVTHDGTKMSCWALSELAHFRDTIGPATYDKINVIGIDEAQFFEDLHDFCCNAADRDGKTVIVAGLDGDYLRKKFGAVLDIIPIANSITKLTARCEMCGQKAFFTLRKSKETQTELIGGADKYMPVCRQHYVNGQQIVIEATRIVLDVERSAVVRS